MEKKLKLSKLNVAKRQLETAIRLYFNDDDPVSIHTLACAAHGILSDLNKKYNGNPMMLSDYIISDEYKTEWNKKIREPQNFFKHADNDSVKSIEFTPELTEYFIFDATSKYQEMTGKIIHYFIIFRGWFAAHNIEAFNYSKNNKQLITEIVNKYKDNRKQYFLDLLYVSGIYEKYFNNKLKTIS